LKNKTNGGGENIGEGVKLTGVIKNYCKTPNCQKFFEPAAS